MEVAEHHLLTPHMSNKNRNGFAVYGAVSQLAFSVAAPLLLFIWGGGWLIEKYNLPEWLTPVSVLLGIVFMIGSAVSYFCRLIAMYGRDSKSESAGETERKLNVNKRENDYYAD
jgi:hypothetical protein